MQINDLDELSYDVEQDGVLIRRELERVISTKGAWATVMFLYEDRDVVAGGDVSSAPWKSAKVAILRLQKVGDGYKKTAGFTLGGAKEARTMANTLLGWFEEKSSEPSDVTS